MPEIIMDLETTVVTPQGSEYNAQVVAEPGSSGLWEAWLEFVPLAEDLDVLLTDTETTQSSREDVVHWAAALAPVYVQGAFARAVPLSGSRGLVRSYDTTVGAIPFDPFEMLTLDGKHRMRARLRALTRAELLGMIDEYNLNPAAKSLLRLSDSQLATFIVTAVEIQSTRGRPVR